MKKRFSLLTAVLLLSGLLPGFDVLGAGTADLWIKMTLPPQLEPFSDPDVPQEITVMNVGSETVPGATVTEIIPPGLSFFPAVSPSYCLASAGVVTCTLPSLAPGQFTTFMLYLLAPRNMTCPSTLTKTVTVTTVGIIDVNLSNNTSTASALITCPVSSSSSSSSQPPLAKCRDGIDNDGDGLIDFPADPGCSSLQDNSELNGTGGSNNQNNNVNTQNVTVTTAGQTITIPSPNINVTTTAPAVNATATASPSSTFGNPAGGGFGQYPPYPPYPPYPQYSPYPQYPTPFSAYPSYALGNQYPSYIQNNQYPSYIPYGQYPQYGQPYSPAYFPYLSTNAYLNAAQCSDGIDNDNDGAVDYPRDLGCVSPQDNNEINDYFYGNASAPQCRDGIDNDRDGTVDYPRDLSCSSPNDNDEKYPLPHCSDGIDNDGDRLFDYPRDPGCVNPRDNNESRR